MDAQVQEIIQKIHEDGVKDAEKRAKEILAEAERQASERVDEAKKNAEKIVADAHAETARMKQAGEASLQQAGRDVVLAVKQELTDLFQRVIQATTAEAMTPEQVGTIIASVVEAWSRTGEESFEALVNEKDSKAVEATMLQRLSDRLKEGVEIRPVKTIAAGFQIGEKGGSSHFDFSDEAIAEMLAQFLNARLAELLNTAGTQSK